MKTLLKGRGTSHKEGYAIAGAVLEELCGWQATDHDKSSGSQNIQGIGCRTLFATHYHDMIYNASQYDDYAKVKIKSIELKCEKKSK